MRFAAFVRHRRGHARAARLVCLRPL